MIDNSFVEKHQPTVVKVARAASVRWNGIMDPDDIEQSLWMFIMERPSVSTYMESHSDGEIVNALRRQADSICSEERAAYDYFAGNYHYNTGEVASMFSRLLEDERLLSDERVDLQLGLDELKAFHPNYFERVQRYFIEGQPYSSSAEQRSKSRALEKLTSIMNRKRNERERNRTEGPGTRNARQHQKEEEWLNSQ